MLTLMPLGPGLKLLKARLLGLLISVLEYERHGRWHYWRGLRWRWEIKPVDCWLGTFGPIQKGDEWHVWSTLPITLGLPLVPVHLVWRARTVLDLVPIIIKDQRGNVRGDATLPPNGFELQQARNNGTLTMRGTVYHVLNVDIDRETLDPAFAASPVIVTIHDPKVEPRERPAGPVYTFGSLEDALYNTGAGPDDLY